SRIWETWRDKLLHLPSKWNQAAAAMARYNAIERQARRVAAGLPPVERKPLHSMVPAAQPEQTIKPTKIGFDPSQSPNNASAANPPQVPKESGVGHISETVEEEEPAVAVQPVIEGTWEEIEISFLSDDRVQFLRGGK